VVLGLFGVVYLAGTSLLGVANARDLLNRAARRAR
jgi:hypothetical protein